MSPRALAVDAAGSRPSVAWGPGGRAIAVPGGPGADQALLRAAAELLAEADAAGGLEALYVTDGPGSFTGLRVGLALVTGLAVARGLPVRAVGALELRAAVAPGHPRVLALMDALRGRVYAGRFDVQTGVPVPIGPPVDLPFDALLAELDPGWVVVADEIEPWAAALRAAGHLPGVPAPVGALAARAGSLVAPLALRLLEIGPGAPARPAAEVGLRYVRPPDVRIPTGLQAGARPG